MKRQYFFVKEFNVNVKKKVLFVIETETGESAYCDCGGVFKKPTRIKINFLTFESRKQRRHF